MKVDYQKCLCDMLDIIIMNFLRRIEYHSACAQWVYSFYHVKCYYEKHEIHSQTPKTGIL